MPFAYRRPPGEDHRSTPSHSPSPSVPSLAAPTSDTPYASSEVSHHPPQANQHHRQFSQAQAAVVSRPSSAASSPFSIADRPRPHQKLPSLQTFTRPARSDSLGQSPSPTPISSSGASSSPIRRKPLSSTASPLAARYSSTDSLSGVSQAQLNRPEQRFSRSFSIDSPTFYEFPQPARIASAVSVLVPARKDVQSPLGSSVHSHDLHAPSANPGVGAAESSSRNIPDGNPAALQTARGDVLSQYEERSTDTTSLTTQEPPSHQSLAVVSNPDNINTNSTTMSLVARKPTPAHLQLGPASNSNFRATTPTNTTASLSTTTLTAHQQNDPYKDKPLPRSPFAAYFVWGGAASPSVTEFSDNGFSPIPSPFSSQNPTSITDDSPVSLGAPQSSTFEPPKASDSPANPLGYCERDLQTPPAVAPAQTLQIEEMEEELRAISADLAGSIRREMDLEDLVDRLQAQINNPQAPGKRTSDYFSDSGYSSAKFSDYDQAKEEIEQIQRKAEQEKASVRLELTTKLQDERIKRKQLDQQIKELAEKASQVDVARLKGIDASGRLKELENTCDDLRRKLSGERQAKNNFEDLLTALKGELQNAANERDNLRDEIVPQLRARVEGLETQAAENSKLTYEATKMQQELQTLKNVNKSLMSGSGQVKNRGNPYNGPPPAKSAQPLQQPTGLSRQTSVKQGSATSGSAGVESRDQLSERLKDVEAQRDALHSALRSLLERQEFQNRENEKKIRALEQERDRLLASEPKKASYEKQIADLRNEINVLRRRAEDAMEQKWVVEKGLTSLRMDLDRAEEEVASLRALLRAKDILIPPSASRSGSPGKLASSSLASGPVSSASLEQAYKDLQSAHTEALDKIKALELSGGPQDERTRLALQRLEASLASALSERDLARQEASQLKSRAETLAGESATHLESEQGLAAQLDASARRVEELAAQVRGQLKANDSLRKRLADAASRGDADQKALRDRVATLQARLRDLEDQVAGAQQQAEERVRRHEGDVQALRDAHSAQLTRAGRERDADKAERDRAERDATRARDDRTRLETELRDAKRQIAKANTFPSTPGLRTPATPLSPFGLGSPGLKSSPRSVGGGGLVNNDAATAEVEALRRRVAELEKAVSAADSEMAEVVGKMSAAQIEVMQLQEEREAAQRETRRLVKVLQDEKVKGFEERWKTLGSPGVK